MNITDTHVNQDDINEFLAELDAHGLGPEDYGLTTPQQIVNYVQIQKNQFAHLLADLTKKADWNPSYEDISEDIEF